MAGERSREHRPNLTSPEVSRLAYLALRYTLLVHGKWMFPGRPDRKPDRHYVKLGNGLDDYLTGTILGGTIAGSDYEARLRDQLLNGRAILQLDMPAAGEYIIAKPAYIPSGSMLEKTLLTDNFQLHGLDEYVIFHKVEIARENLTELHTRFSAVTGVGALEFYRQVQQEIAALPEPTL
jgi:hypothetical protein